MSKRFLVIWFRYLKTDWFCRRNPAFRHLPFVLTTPSRGRIIVTAANNDAIARGIETGMVLSDARALLPSLQVKDDDPQLPSRLLNSLAEWSIRFSPTVSVHLPADLVIDITGCAHLWGGELRYLREIVTRLTQLGYTVRTAIADTIGATWAVAHYGSASIIEPSKQLTAIMELPPEALRISPDITERLHKLGLSRIDRFISMPRSALRRRFGEQVLRRMDEALGLVEELLQPVQPAASYLERLFCLEPVVTATAIEIGLKKLIDKLCDQLRQEGKGLRHAVLKCYRVDNKTEQVEITTNHTTTNEQHLFKLFELKIATIEPALGIELFTLEAKKVEDASPVQERLWETRSGLEDPRLFQLLDRITGKFGADRVLRYLPAEHYWPERSYKIASSLSETPDTVWKVDRPRPLRLFAQPQPIEVTAPIPDYPPMLFRFKGKLHKIINADGPERIEQEWWLQQGQHRDYYTVEDEEGQRYWLFRSGHYSDHSYQWFIHGFFA